MPISRPLLLSMLHRATAPHITIGEFAMRYGEWEFIPIMAKDAVIGVVISLGPEIHMTIEPQYHRRVTTWRDGMKEIVQPIIDEYGFATTRVPLEDTNAHKFVERLGFHPDSSRDGMIGYRLTELKLRYKTCQ